MNKFLEHILLSDDVSDDERRRLTDLCRTDASTATSVRRFVSLLTEMERVENVERAVSEESDFNDAWDVEFPSVTSESEHVSLIQDRPKLRLVQRPTVLRWVAAAALIVSIGLFWQVVDQPSAEQSQTFAASDNAYLIHQLADGSVIRLSPGSSVGVATDGTVTLQGSAFFSVTPQASTMKVVTARTTTEVLGTQFGIVESTNLTRIVMMEGVVSFSSNAMPNEQVRLELNQTSTVVGSDAPSTPSIVDISSALSWTDLILFRAAPLETVATILSDKFQISISVDESISQLTFTNTFRPEQGIQEILNTVALASGVDVVANPEAGGFVLQPKQ